MKLILMGTGPFAVPTLRRLHAGQHEIVQVVCRPPRGRRKEPPAPVRAAAEELGLPLWMPESANLPDSQQRLAEIGADLLVVCDYGEILKDATLSTTRLGGVNLHGSLLPKYRGAAPVQWAVLKGDAETGATVIQMTPGLDAGPILGKVTTPIDPDETAGELEVRLADLGAELTATVVDELAAGTATAEPQDKSQVSKAPRLDKACGQINWTRPADWIKNHVRGMHPWPRAFTFLSRSGGEPLRLSIDRVAVVDASEVGSNGSPGVVRIADDRLFVTCGENSALEILTLQPAGKRAMSAADWLRGAPLRSGDAFTSNAS
ncbi:MAG: methionyl-tRNA formyltransferase [Planctomycetota bacterium]